MYGTILSKVYRYVSLWFDMPGGIIAALCRVMLRGFAMFFFWKNRTYRDRVLIDFANVGKVVFRWWCTFPARSLIKTGPVPGCYLRSSRFTCFRFSGAGVSIETGVSLCIGIETGNGLFSFSHIVIIRCMQVLQIYGLPAPLSSISVVYRPLCSLAAHRVHGTHAPLASLHTFGSFLCSR